MKRVALATVILSAIALTAEAQQAIRVSGRVLADETGDPLPNARVTTLSPAAPGAAVVLTDRDGRFTLTTQIPATLTASKSSYTHRELKVTTADARLELRLFRAAVIAGHAIDEFGDPVAGALIVVKRAAPRLPRGLILARSTTDDRGDYRIGSLTPGPVVVSVISRGEMIQQVIGPNQIAMTPSRRETFYPGTVSEDEAETMRLQSGDERLTVDFVLPAGQAGDEFPFLMLPFGSRPEAAQWTGVIRGRVVSTDGRGIARAEVRAFPGPPPARAATDGVAQGFSPANAVGTAAMIRFQPTTVTADNDGRFTFEGLPPGSFRITGQKVGYSMPGEDAMHIVAINAGIAVELRDAEVKDRVDLTLAPWGSLSGRVVDELGEPLQGVSVQLLQVRYQGGRRRLVGAGGAARLTDDLGRYRVYGLAPGKYIVSAAVGDVASADLPGYTRSYFPGTPTAGDAQFVSVDLSEQVTGIDFSLARGRTASISGRIINAAGAPTSGGSVKLIPSQRSTAVTSLPAGARLENDGRFEFPNVTTGQYIIQVDRGRRGSTEGEFAALPVSVDGVDVNGLVVQLSAGSSIVGRVTFDSFQGATLPRPGQIEITPVPIDADQSTANPANAAIHDDWTFEVGGVNGPRRLQLRQTPAGWTLKAITVRGIDVTDRPLPFGRRDQSLADVEVVLTDRPTGVSGTIVDDRARPAAGAHLVVFSIDRDRWSPGSRYVRTAVAAGDGAIALDGLAPGSYYASAVARLPADGSDAWQDPAFLESLVPRASSFAVGEGERRVLSLKLP
jgi:protocatechuate 3,4-dioxygenase beta subunit